MTDPLLVPLNVLPGPVPVGAPVVIDPPDGMTPSVVLLGARGQWRVVAWPAGRAHFVAADERLDLDLRAPPPDVDGWLTRIDGLDVAVTMLLRALTEGEGRPCSVGWYGMEATTPTWALTVDDVWVTFSRSAVPVLADIDPTHPDADRLAMAAVLRAQPWRDQREPCTP